MLRRHRDLGLTVPDWSPNWTDVVFDHVAAEAAAAACRTAAAVAELAEAGLADGYAAAVENWSGRYRDQFDDEQRPLSDELNASAHDLRRLAREIEAASAAATAEQQRREAGRARWHEERAVEVARRRTVSGPTPM